MTETFTKQSVSHESAQKMVAAAVAKATALGVPQVVAVLDESGLLKAFCRMDGAALVSLEVAQNKAYIALCWYHPGTSVYVLTQLRSQIFGDGGSKGSPATLPWRRSIQSWSNH